MFPPVSILPEELKSQHEQPTTIYAVRAEVRDWVVSLVGDRACEVFVSVVTESRNRR